MIHVLSLLLANLEYFFLIHIVNGRIVYIQFAATLKAVCNSLYAFIIFPSKMVLPSNLLYATYDIQETKN